MVKYQPKQKGKGGQTGASTSTTTSGTTPPDIASVLAAIDRALSQPAPQESEAQEPGAEEPVDRQQILQHQEQGHMEQELPPSEMLCKALEEQKRIASEELERQKREQEREQKEREEQESRERDEQRRYVREELERRQREEQELERIKAAYEQKAASFQEEFDRILREAWNINTSASRRQVLIGKARDVIAKFTREQQAVLHRKFRLNKGGNLSPGQMENLVGLLSDYATGTGQKAARTTRRGCCYC